MPTVNDLRMSAQLHGMEFTDEQLQRLARGEEVALPEAPIVEADQLADDCCPDGYIGIGHHPRWCIRINPPAVTICAG